MAAPMPRDPPVTSAMRCVAWVFMSYLRLDGGEAYLELFQKKDNYSIFANIISSALIMGE
jgi:hypothetical protein